MGAGWRRGVAGAFAAVALLTSVAINQTPTSAGSGGGPYPRPDTYFGDRRVVTVTKSPTGIACIGDTVKFVVTVRAISVFGINPGPAKNAGKAGYEVDRGLIWVPIAVDYDPSHLRPIGQSPRQDVQNFRAIATGWTTLKFSTTDSYGQTWSQDRALFTQDCDYRLMTLSTWFVSAEANVMAVDLTNTLLKATLTDPSHLELSNPSATAYSIAASVVPRACPASEHMTSATMSVDGQVDLDAGTMFVNVPYPSVPVGTYVVCLVVQGSNKLPDHGDPYPFKVNMDSIEGGVADIPEPQMRVPGLGVSDGDTHVIIRKLRPTP